MYPMELFPEKLQVPFFKKEKILFLEVSHNSQEITLYQSIFFNKVAGLRLQIY